MNGRAAWGIGGLLAGALLSAVLLRLVETRRAESGGGETASHAGAPDAGGGEAKKEAERLRGELAAAVRESDTLRAEVADLRRKSEETGKEGPGGGKAGGPAAAKTWREIAARLWKLRDKVRGKKWDDWPDDSKDLQLMMFQKVGELSKELGVTFDEAVMSPEGVSRLLLDLLEQTEPPPSEEEKKRLEALLAGSSTAWNEYLATRDQLSRLEQRLAQTALGEKSLGAILAGLRPEQLELAQRYEIFQVHDDGGPQTWIDGSREKVTKDLTANWVNVLKLDPIQEGAIRPVVDEYIVKASEMNQAFWRKKQEGAEVPRRVEYEAQVKLMIETQQKLAASARLTDEQAKSMKEWGEVYGVNVWDPPPPPPPQK